MDAKGRCRDSMGNLNPGAVVRDAGEMRLPKHDA